ncbi:MAG: aldo/keto reductase [Clostridia bacterium]|nr:aldo/keto reductase [Clostridia bacterium]
MRYRISKKTGDKISEIGLGSAYMPETPLPKAIAALQRAYEGGINYYDLAAGDGKAFPMFGEAFAGVRGKILYQIHFGADYSGGTYGWSLDLDTVKRSIDMQLKELRTDYIDYGFIHCQDELADWETYQNRGIFAYILQLKKLGVVRHIGLSSHTPTVIERILNDVDVDMLMFSINPAYDYGQGEFANGSADERAAVYRRCEAEGIGISVMKPFSAGQLLDARQSPFGQALTAYQCIRYALDRPGVLTVLPGAQTVGEIEKLLAYEHQPEESLDYSIISSFAPPQASGKCVYCNHCKPCPVGIDIGLVNKYYDLARAGDKLAIQHYKTLEKNAKDCIRCGHCDSRCPFSVCQSERMQEICSLMG